MGYYHNFIRHYAHIFLHTALMPYQHFLSATFVSTITKNKLVTVRIRPNNICSQVSIMVHGKVEVII